MSGGLTSTSSTQTLTAYEGNRAVLLHARIFIRAARYADGDRPVSHLPDASRPRRWTAATLGYDYYLPNVPYVMYFYQGYALHGTYWHSNFGRPMSHGCVNLETG